MAKVDTLPELYRPLMEGTSVETTFCCVCGRAWPLNRHHVVKRSAGELYRSGVKLPKPTLILCGSGNVSGCHGLAHQNRLHFRWAVPDWLKGRDLLQSGTVTQYDTMPCRGGHWEYLITDEPTKYQEALEMDGWRPIRDEADFS